jgi:MSHA biogenesis protein MshM
VHHFHMQPLSRNILESYLMFRMRAAGYHGPNIFSTNAIKMIASASDGLMRRVNILADKSLLAAFVDDTHNIETHHVQAAMRDSELSPAQKLPGKKLLLGSALTALLLIGLTAWWMLNKPQTSPQGKPPATVAAPATSVMPAQPIAAHPNNARVPASAGEANKAVESPPVSLSSDPASKNPSLFEQRLTAGKQLLDQKKAAASIQLFYNEEINKERIEGFLRRADKLGKLPEIYLLPAKFGSKDGLRVLYGAYPTVEAAHNAIKDLPARYQEAFATSTYIF